MTPKLLQVLFIFLFCMAFKGTNAQDFTSKDLYGKWDCKMGETPMTYNFVNDSAVICNFPGVPKESNIHCYYKFIF